MDEDQGNTGAMRSEEEEENHREDVRKLVEMMQKEEVGKGRESGQEEKREREELARSSQNEVEAQPKWQLPEARGCLLSEEGQRSRTRKFVAFGKRSDTRGCC